MLLLRTIQGLLMPGLLVVAVPYVTERFTGRPGRYVPVKETVQGFLEILEGKHDDLPEQAFYMVGNIQEAREQGERLAKENA